jgi:predicted transcriptional regulator
MCVTKTTVYLDDEVALRLRQLAESTGRPQAELIRSALEEYTSRRTAPRRIPGAGEYRSGRSDISDNAEEILDQAARRKEWA